MKKWKRLCVLTVLLLTAAGCSGRQETAHLAESAMEGVDSLTPTGYPSDEVQRASVHYDGVLYLYTGEGFDLPLEDGFLKVGTVESVDNEEYPKENFYAARLEEGQEIYANPEVTERIYVRYDSGFAPFEKEAAAFAKEESGASVIPHINDGESDWSGVAKVSLYGEGCAVPPTRVIEAEETVALLVEEVCRADDYRKVGRDHYLEGMNGIWVEFDNGVCISMYRNENYGTISMEKETTGKPPFYEFPKAFRETVLDLLE